MESSQENKQTQAKKLIERYFFQLTTGCGKPDCTNKYCASSGLVEKLCGNQAAIKSLQLYVDQAKLCDTSTSVVIKDVEMIISDLSKSNSSTSKNEPAMSSDNSGTSNNSPTSSSSKEILFVDETKLNELMDLCEQTKDFAPIIRCLGSILYSKESVVKSFQRKTKSSIDVIFDRVKPSSINTMKKEDIRTLEDDEKEEDSMATEEETKLNDPTYTPVDVESIRRCMTRLFQLNPNVFESLDSPIQGLSSMLHLDMHLLKSDEEFEDILTVIVILFEIFNITNGQLEQSIVRILPVIANLPVQAQARLAQIWSSHCKNDLSTILLHLQQIITLQVIANVYNRENHVNDNEIITNAVKVMKIVYCANILTSDVGGETKFMTQETNGGLGSILEDEEDDFSSIVYPFDPSKSTKFFDDPLMKQLGICIEQCREPLIPFEEFQNEPLCDVVEMDVEFIRYRRLLAIDKLAEDKRFSFIFYSFVLTPITKSTALFYDSRIRMFSERRTSMMNMHFLGQPTNPYLKLKIRRDFLIDDALAELEMVAMSNPKDLRKQIFIEFDGEQGIDEGGVSKEFFQLIVEEIFNPDYGMFVDVNGTSWFNSFSFENTAQYTLIGIVLGLAIYNHVILPVNFPIVVYRKLMNWKLTWHDLKDFNPVIYNSLKSLLTYDEPDIEEVFSQTFEIGYQDVFGSSLKHNLKKDGDKIFVNHFNKQEFVELYADFLMNKSIEKQFKAFKKGFRMVTDESPLSYLFRPEEIELLVCGSNNFDFDELEKSTEYEGGYSSNSEIIKHFWSIVHGFSLESKRKLLQFTTGSNRVPIGGFSKLKLVIARHGPDCDRLPTSHTCFNILLLPEYSAREKLEERLLKAINYSKGFGML
ncbi:CLUMA_CG010297, isoform A [Clunio marinus]|uniref:HECT-type E3 ubiquitin transferase n=1 Tax=Clunio marinus TaxID=568069 RepID=A0A1J1IB70_9DIPT|nr:CLUMA_CG010297, isoform A [Clunio marinus]